MNVDETKHKLEVAECALTLACEHIAKENPLLLSVVGKGLIPAVRERFITRAEFELQIKELTEAQKDKDE